MMYKPFYEYFFSKEEEESVGGQPGNEADTKSAGQQQKSGPGESLQSSTSLATNEPPKKFSDVELPFLFNFLELKSL